MQIILILCMLLPLQASTEQKPAAGAAGVEQSIIARQHELDKAWLRHDTAAVGRMFADDYPSITHTGRVIGKAEIIKAMAASSGYLALQERAHGLKPGGSILVCGEGNIAVRPDQR